jgi:hypothetical protein
MHRFTLILATAAVGGGSALMWGDTTAQIDTPSGARSEATVTSPSCAHPAFLGSHSPFQGKYGDYIVFQRGTDLRIDAATLRERYTLNIVGYVKWEAGLQGAIVAPALTPSQVAELRCDPVIDLLSLQRGNPWQSIHELPYKNVRLGIGTDNVADAKAGGRVPRGAAVTSVGPDTVASRAGLLEKDVVVKFDGQDINSIDDLSILVMEKMPGDTVPMVVSRNGHKLPLIAQF